MAHDPSLDLTFAIFDWNWNEIMERQFKISMV